MKGKHILLRCMAICLCLILFTVSVCSEKEAGHVFAKNRSKSKKVALTFDDGPHPRYTEAILDILEEYGITATFFVIGVNVENYPRAMERLISSGCEIGNHTYSHKNITKENEQDIIREIQQCEEAIMKMTNQKPCLLRPPEGAYEKNLCNMALKLNYNIILWSIDTMDWAHNPSQKIADEVLSSLSDGDIILMHDYVSGKNTTCEALRLMIPEILKRGYEFVTVSELISGEDA